MDRRLIGNLNAWDEQIGEALEAPIRDEENGRADLEAGNRMVAGNAARDNKKTRFNPRHLQLAVGNDKNDEGGSKKWLEFAWSERTNVLLLIIAMAVVGQLAFWIRFG